MHYAFGPFVLDNGGRVLRRGDETIPLGRRGLALLKTLLSAEGAALSKEQLRAEVWPGLVVEDVNLSVQIAHLRKALGKAPDGQDWVVTVPRFGYRLSTVAQLEQGRPPVPMLVVLPLLNLTGDLSRQHVVEGLVDELIAALSRFRGFGVFSRSASFAHREKTNPADSIGADYLLEGSLRMLGDVLRLVLTLAGKDGRSLWSGTFSGRIDDVFSFQDEVVRQVAAIIEPRIQATELSRSWRQRPSSLDAYDMFLRGVAKLYEFEETPNAEAISLLERAISIEPENGAYLGFACWALEMRITMGWPALSDSDRHRCIELANDAITRAGDDAVVLAHCGVALQLVGLEYDRGLAVAERAVACNPNDPVALVNAGLAHYLGGSLESALERLHYCIALQPNDAYDAMGIISNVYAGLNRHEEALLWAKRGLAINASFQPNHWVAVASAAHLGRLDEAREALVRLLSHAPGLTVAKLLRVRPRDHSRDEGIVGGLRLAGMPYS